jgi:hypothetical protein
MALSKGFSALRLNRTNVRRLRLRGGFWGCCKQLVAASPVEDLNAPQISVIRATPYIAHRRGMPMPTKRKLAAKKAARTREVRSAGKNAAKTRKLKATGRKAAKTRKRKAPARKAVATKKLRSAAAEAPPTVAGAQAVAPEVLPAPAETPDIIMD